MPCDTISAIETQIKLDISPSVIPKLFEQVIKINIAKAYQNFFDPKAFESALNICFKVSIYYIIIKLIPKLIV